MLFLQTMELVMKEVNRVLLMLQQLPINLSTGLLGYWKFDKTSDTTAVDSSVNANMETLVNGPARTSGRISGALSFDGVNDYITITNESRVMPMGGGRSVY